jgi:uncharacterized damage-inducible protein DinB
MTHQQFVLSQLEVMNKFLHAVVAGFTEEDSNYSPQPEMFTVAQQVHHIGQTVDWFMDGTFSGKGFSMQFEVLVAETRACKSFTEALRFFDEACARATTAIKTMSEEKLTASFDDTAIMQGERWTFVTGLADHTAHHRGSLVVYLRLLGRVPAMPYM